ncbi:MAG: TonB-dependent receptor [Sandaracinaceae bacterium]
MRAVAPSAILLALVLAVPGPAMAQRARDPRLDLAAEADIQFELGVEAQQRNDYRRALEHYLHSNRLAYNKNVVFNIARCYELLDRYAEAHRYYSDYLDEELGEEDRQVATAARDRVGRHVALLEITSTPPGASIYLGRVELGTRGVTPRTLAVEPGTVRVVVEREGYEGASAEVEARRGETSPVQLSLVPILGIVHLTGGPEGAEVRIDDPDAAPVATVPGDVPVVPGRHTLLVSRDGYQSGHVEVTVAPREELHREVTLEVVTGSVLVDVQERGALIEIDGAAAGFTPAVLPRVAVGTHRLRILRPGFRPIEETIEVAPEAQTEVQARLHLEQEVTAASRQAESVFDAPASVTILPQEELRAFGFQTVWDALGGVRGIYQTNDRSYASLGFRGFSQPQDYGNRVLSLTDGHVMNDDLLGSSYVGFDARSDLMDVERIEVVRGPGSALYGTNAFFGVINLVTRDRDSLMRPHASIATDGFRMGRLRVGGGTRFSEDAGFWASASGILAQGDDVSLPELSPAADGLVRDADGFYTATGMARAWFGDFTIEGYYHRRQKRIPTGAFGTILGDPRTQNTDSRGFVELRWEPRLSEEVALSARVFLDYYEYEGDFAYDPAGTPDPETGVIRDRWLGYWTGGEARVLIHPVEWLRITAGAEARGSLVADLSSQSDAAGRYLDETPRFFVFGGYAVAQLDPIREVSVHLGGRYDFVSTFADGAVSPRATVILRPWDTGIFKLIGGSAFRAPSVYELRYNDGGLTQVSPDALSPERIWTGELEFTQRIEEELSAIVSVFYNYIENPITTEALPTDPSVFRYTNSADVAQTIGAEAEIRREWRQGWMLSASYAFQRTRIGDLGSEADAARLTNSPEHLVSFRGAAPLVPELLTLALRLRVESPRLGLRVASDGSTSLVEGEVPVLADLVLSGEVAEIGVSYALGVRNLLDWQYGYPGGEDVAVPFLPQPGRSFFLQTTVRF